MPATYEDLTIEQGTTWSTGWAVEYSPDGGTTFEPIDETWTVRSQVRDDESGELLHTFATTVEAGMDEDDNGVMAAVIAVSPSISSAWAWRGGQYDVEVVNADQSVVLRVAEGYVTVKPEVTR